MKRIAKENLTNKKMEENTKLEKFILSNLEHPFITSLKFAFKDSRYVYLVMECAIGGPVESFLFINKNLNPRKNLRIKKFA
jgi:serine/threonine protein kinase